MKKWIALMLALTMLFMNFAVAEEIGEIKNVTQDGLEATDRLIGLPMPQLPLVDKPMTLTVMYPRETNHGNFDDMWFLKEVASQTGITLDVQAIESIGWTEKIALVFASGDYSDIILRGLPLNDASIYGAAGMLLPLEDLIAKYAPNAQLLLDVLTDTTKDITTEDGHIYVMPSYDTPGRDMIQKVGFINDAWLDRLGLKRPTTVDELYDCLVAVRDHDANGNGDPFDEIPMSYVYDSAHYNLGTVILFAFGYVDMLHDIIDGRYVYVPMQDNFREYLRFMNKLYEDGLLDPEIFTQTKAQYNAKLSEYTVFCTTPEMQSSFPEEFRQIEYSLIGPLTSDFSATPMWAANPSGKIATSSFAITNKCSEEKAIAAIKLLDYFYSEEASFMTKCGPEKGKWDGVGGWSYEEKADGSNPYTIDYDSEHYNSFWDFRCANGLMNNPFLYTSHHAELVLGASVWGNHLSNSAYDSGAFAVRRFGYPQGVTFSEDEQDTLAMFILMDSYVDQNVAKFISGSLDIDDDAAWDHYIQGIKDMNVETMIEVRQAAYDRWNNK